MRILQPDHEKMLIALKIKEPGSLPVLSRKHLIIFMFVNPPIPCRAPAAQSASNIVPTGTDWCRCAKRSRVPSLAERQHAVRAGPVARNDREPAPGD